MTTEEVLIAAREKIADRKHWTKGALARNAKSKPVPVNDPAACRWCSEGAIRACGGDYRVIDAFNKLAGDATWFVNDNNTHAKVLAIWDQAIASEQARSAPAS